ncbi:hypothetical protein LPJ75_007015, partial [Coemansia sp. RSA 2598]
MEQLAQYLVGVIESSYQDLAHMVPCGSFLGLFDERPTKRTRVDGSIGLDAAGGWSQGSSSSRLFEFDDSETT